MLTHYQDLGLRKVGSQKAGYFQSVHARHTYIEQNQVGPEFPRLQKRSGAVFGFATDFPVRLG